jgi:hypothetical protein
MQSPQATFQRLLVEREQSVRREFKAEDSGGFNEALDLLDQKEANRQMDKAILLTGTGPAKAERVDHFRI